MWPSAVQRGRPSGPGAFRFHMERAAVDTSSAVKGVPTTCCSAGPFGWLGEREPTMLFFVTAYFGVPQHRKTVYVRRVCSLIHKDQHRLQHRLWVG